jgi:hypothetical protein
MPSKSTIQSFINNFRRRIAVYLKPGVGLSCVVHPAIAGGAILEFRVGTAIENDDIHQTPVATLGRALSGIEQNAFGGNLEGFNFGGTNLIMESDKIILIKDDSPSEWSDEAAERDVQRVAPSKAKGAR